MYEIWNRLQYMLSPQFDIYEKVSQIVSGDVLDVGCGTGFGTHLFTRFADNVYGIDVDEKAVQFAKKCFGNHRILFNHINLENITRSYDFVTMIDVIEHIEYDQKAIGLAKGCLKDNGVFVISTPNRLSRYRKSENHVREYAPHELRALLFKEFKDVQILDYKLDPVSSDYENPIVGVCRC